MSTIELSAHISADGRVTVPPIPNWPGGEGQHASLRPIVGNGRRRLPGKDASGIKNCGENAGRIFGGVGMRIMRMCLIMAASLVCVNGCAKEQYVRSHSRTTFAVDGEIYSLEAHTEVDKRGGVVASLLVIRGSGTPGSSWSETSSRRGVTDAVWKLNGKEVISKTDTVYFFQGGEITFEKNYRDLGIDSQQINTGHNGALDYLQPILVNLIREHVSPQE